MDNDNDSCFKGSCLFDDRRCFTDRPLAYIAVKWYEVHKIVLGNIVVNSETARFFLD